MKNIFTYIYTVFKKEFKNKFEIQADYDYFN